MRDLDKSIWIDAPPDIVFEYFTDPKKMVRWCDRTAGVEPNPQGLYRVDMGGAGVIEGRFLKIEAPSLVLFEARAGAAPPSLIEVRITPESDGSRVDVTQSGLDLSIDEAAGRGWDFHLARLSVAASGGSPGEDSFCRRFVGGVY